MRKPFRITALTAACVATFALGACTAEATGSQGDTPVDTGSQAPANPAAALVGKWEYRVEQLGTVTSFTVGADGMVTEFWKEGTVGEMSATLAAAADRTYTLAWKAVSEEPGNSQDGVITLTPDPGGESLTGDLDPGDDGRTITFEKAA